jgi:dienelactone hydrolase
MGSCFQAVEYCLWSYVVLSLFIHEEKLLTITEFDAANAPAARQATEGILIKKNSTFQTSLYAGAEHGFAVRTNLSDPKKAYAQESAYFQAVRWFDTWIK